MTYANGTAQFHWGVSPKDCWVLYDVKADPGCKNDLPKTRPTLLEKLSDEYEIWWDNVYPEMISKGGDLGSTKPIFRKRK
jgi:hypothetical protein